MVSGGGEIRSGRRPKFDLRTLEKIRSVSRSFKLPADVKAPVVAGYKKGRKTVDIDIQRAFRTQGNGLRQKTVLDQSTIDEADFPEWQRQVGKIGDPGTSRAEFQIFRSFERQGWRFPESRPPGSDVEYLARVSGNVGGIEIDFFIRDRGIAIRVQGEYWHYRDATVIEQGEAERVILESQGLTVVDILAQDTVRGHSRTDYIVHLAMNGFGVDITGRTGIFRGRSG